MAPKVTSSSDRRRRKSKKPVTKGQNPQRSNRQKVSTASVTQGNNDTRYRPTHGAGARVTESGFSGNSGNSGRITGSVQSPSIGATGPRGAQGPMTPPIQGPQVPPRQGLSVSPTAPTPPSMPPSQPFKGGGDPPKPSQTNRGGLNIPGAGMITRGLGVLNLLNAQTPADQFMAGMQITNPVMGGALQTLNILNHHLNNLMGTTGLADPTGGNHYLPQSGKSNAQEIKASQDRGTGVSTGQQQGPPVPTQAPVDPAQNQAQAYENAGRGGKGGQFDQSAQQQAPQTPPQQQPPQQPQISPEQARRQQFNQRYDEMRKMVEAGTLDEELFAEIGMMMHKHYFGKK